MFEVVFCVRALRFFVFSALIVFVQSSFGANVKLSWNPSPSTVTSYKVYYGPAPGAYVGSVQVSAPATSAVVSNLVAGAYYFSATAISSNGVESLYSNVAAYSVIANAAPVATAITVGTMEDAPVAVTLRGTDADGDALTFA